MFKNPFQVAIVFAMVALVIKVALFTMDVQHGAMENGIRYIYMLLILMAVFFGIRSNKVASDTQTTFGQDFRAGARTASFFAILTAIITYVYYAKIDAQFFEVKQEPLLAELRDQVKIDIAEAKTPKDFELLKENVTNQIYSFKMYLSPYFQAMWTMFGLVFLGLFNSAVFSILMKKFPGFKK
jgi:hypothetical protein